MRLIKWGLAGLCFVAISVLAQAASNPTPTNRLAWDAVAKEQTCKPGERFAHFAFNVTNVSDRDVIILHTQTTCGCTVAKLPSEPWVLKPGASGQLEVTVDLTNKVGTVRKGVFVTISNAPEQMLFVQATVSLLIPTPPVMSDQDRLRNTLLAKANAQAIFKGSCAECHVAPGKGRMGAELYVAMCGICHDAGVRQASMVPNLHHLKKATDFVFWKNTIANGVTNSLMPAFAATNGGPLSEAQVNSLADYLAKTVPSIAVRPAGRR
jgi:mono/diheme cytochrome c family protein